MRREPFSILEVDIPRCVHAFGVGDCAAALGAGTPRKCFGLYRNCSAREVFSPAPFTLRFCTNSAAMPAGIDAIPILEAVSQITATVNIAGSDEKLGALGRTATAEFTLCNLRHHDRGIDPYYDERLSGAAQFDGVPMDPAARGTYLGRLRARWPYYAGAACRILEGFVEGGAFVEEARRHYVLADWAISNNDRHKLKAKDPLSALDDDKAVFPEVSRGKLAGDISEADLALTLSPPEVGDTYPATGAAAIGSEWVRFSRVGDVVTLTERGWRGTKIASHKAGDTFQVLATIEAMRADDLVELLMGGKIDPALMPKATKWKPIVDRWASSLLFSRDFGPLGRKKLLGELAAAGISIFWDDLAQEVALRVNAPEDEGNIYSLSDFGEILSADLVDADGERLTDVFFYTVQLDPTKASTSQDNFARVTHTIATAEKSPHAYGDTKIKRILFPWFERGNDPAVGVLSRRYLNRFAEPPKRLRVTVSAKDRQIPLFQVCKVDSAVFEDDLGDPAPRLMQVRSRAPKGEGGQVEYILQAYQWLGRYAVATPDYGATYLEATDAQRKRGFWACDPITKRMSNGDEPYRAS